MPEKVKDPTRREIRAACRVLRRRHVAEMRVAWFDRRRVEGRPDNLRRFAYDESAGEYREVA